MQPAAVPDEDFPEAVVGPDESRFQPDPLAEREGPRLLRKKRVRTGLDDEPVDALGRDRAAQPLARFEERQLERDGALARDLDGAMRGRETTDTATDDEKLHRAMSVRRSN